MVSAVHTNVKAAVSRVSSIDLLRGVVMIIMALDHVRDYFHADAFLYNPLDLQKTSVALYATRWITHFCAPVFVFLAGTSAFLVGERKSRGDLASFLLTRGVWLILLEFTLINFSWFFNVKFSFVALTVIWALGIGMILLAAAIYLPYKLIFALGFLLVAGHNLLDGIHVAGEGAGAIFWSLLHEAKVFQIGPFKLFVGYPILPWTGVMFLGYCFGKLYTPSFSDTARRSILIRTGLALIALFILLRAFIGYGEPQRWSVQENPVFTFLSFINVTKYPPSLGYVLITLGPAFIFLAFTEGLQSRLAAWTTALGRVPLFYYIVHIYVIHLVALIAAGATGFDASTMVFNTWVTDSPALRGYGFSLGITYLVWIAIVAALLPLCLWYDRYKTRNREMRWLRYV